MIVGRPTLNKLGAVVSTLHLTMKYPLEGGGIGTIKADQPMARRCYQEILKAGWMPCPSSRKELGIHVLDLDPRGEMVDRRPTPAEDLKMVQIGKTDKQTTRVGVALTLEVEKELIKFLRKNSDVFAWVSADMPGIDPKFTCHRLALDPNAKPVAQRKRRFGEDQRKTIMEETNRLKEANFIIEIKYPTWLANVVMVKKSNGKWRMCTDYTNLNKACPKDSYPLPSIDDLVDGASGYKILSLMDAYSGYNQIWMHPDDEDKTTFMTEGPTIVTE